MASSTSSLHSISKAARKKFIQPVLPLTYTTAQVAEPTTASPPHDDAHAERRSRDGQEGTPAAVTADEADSKTDPVYLASSVETIIPANGISPATQPETGVEHEITEDDNHTAEDLPNGVWSADEAAGKSILSLEDSAASMTISPSNVNGHGGEPILSEDNTFMTALHDAPETPEALEAGTQLESAFTAHLEEVRTPDQERTQLQLQRLQQIPTNEEKILDWAEESAAEAEQLVLSEITSVAQEQLESVNSHSTFNAIASHQASPHAPSEHVLGLSGVNDATHSFASQPAEAETGVLLANGVPPTLPTSDREAADTAGNMANGVPYELDGVRPSTSLLGASEETSTTVSGHLLRLFMTREWADWSIEVVSTTGQFAPVAYPAHSAIMSRSRMLNQKMRDHMLSARLNRVVTLQPPRYLQPPAFEAALKYLYTDITLSRADCSQLFTLGQAYDSRSSREYFFDCVLTYWLSGLCLGLRTVAEQGLAVIHETLDWDTVEVAVRAGLELKTAVQAISSQSIAPMTNSVSQPNEFRKSSTQAVDEANPVGSTIIQVVSNFIAHKLSQGLVSFHLDKSQSQVLPSYLPNPQDIARSSRRTSNPVLAGITFGSMPTSNDLRSQGSTPQSPQPVYSSAPATTKGVADRALSAILLGLPFDDLQLVLSDVWRASRNPSSISTLFAQVVEEREKRRMQVLGSKLVPNADRKAHPDIWNVVGEKERLIRSSRPEDGCFLQREKTSFLLPAKTSVSYS